MKLIKILVGIVVILAILFVGGFTYFSNSLKAVTREPNVVAFTVESGEGYNTVLNKLEDAGLIKNATMAKILLKLEKLNNIKKGDYEIDSSWDTKTILEYLNDPLSALQDTVSITFIEGDWAKHIATKISEVTNVSYDELMNYWNDETVIKSLMDEYPFLTDELFSDDIRIKLEGYLFPNTYQFFRETTKEDITKRLLDQTLVIYNEFKNEIENSNLSVHELFTLASIVQYEASKPSDMALIAGVFYNRMNIGMKLQSSVTVCYAIDKEKEDDWKACEVNPTFDSKYNTYMYKGLPPGPILNPGYEAIKATLNPQSSDYLFFIADVYGDGTVYYAKTYDEHLSLVNKYLK